MNINHASLVLFQIFTMIQATCFLTALYAWSKSAWSRIQWRPKKARKGTAVQSLHPKSENWCCPSDYTASVWVTFLINDINHRDSSYAGARSYGYHTRHYPILPRTRTRPSIIDFRKKLGFCFGPPSPLSRFGTDFGCCVNSSTSVTISGFRLTPSPPQCGRVRGVLHE